jgi:hypothetical protein
VDEGALVETAHTVTQACYRSRAPQGHRSLTSSAQADGHSR